jgi:hypothetical protein
MGGVVIDPPCSLKKQWTYFDLGENKMGTLSRLLNPLLGFLLTLVFGLWLSRRGRPYNGPLFNVHKLIALATVILAVLAVYQMLKVVDAAMVIFVLLAVAAFSVAALFVSGAFMSANQGQYRVMKLIHNISPFILVIAAGCSVYLLRSAY